MRKDPKRLDTITDILKQEKRKSLLKFSMDRSCNDYRSLESKKRCKSGWIETHYHQEELLRKSYTSVVVIGDSIVAGLRRYPTVWRNSFLRYRTINLGIEGDQLENILWRINDIVLPRSVRSVVIHRGTNRWNRMKWVWVLLLLLDLFPIVTQISRLLLVV